MRGEGGFCPLSVQPRSGEKPEEPRSQQTDAADSELSRLRLVTDLPAMLLGPEKRAPPSVLMPRSATARLISSRLVGVARERM